MSQKKDRISVLTLGCSKNTVDSENMLGVFKEAGFNISKDYNNTDYLVINTCGFIKTAKEESIQVILDAIESKKRGDLKKVIVCGCLAERYMEVLKNQIDDVDLFSGLNSVREILLHLKPDFKKELTEERVLLTPKHFAYLKISEGCNHKCSFCSIPLIRGKYISRAENDIINEAKSLAKKGVIELNIIAQDTTYYGIDTQGKSQLAGLLKKTSDIEGLSWIRLLYTYPLNFPYEILDVINERANICKYIDIPLQHVSSGILKDMKRKMNHKQTSELVDIIRDKVKNVAIRSTFITGFPGETDKDFQMLYDFINEKKLDRVGVFTYSHEEGTSAFELGDSVPEEIKNQRRDELMKLQMQISLERNRSFIGKDVKVIIDNVDKSKNYVGRTEHDAPDVDNAVLVKSKKKLNIGDFYNVRITDASEYDLIGKLF
ncbi:MAG: 30S ribosomal protein S12 methylthiotransferase RimO [bacterium]